MPSRWKEGVVATMEGHNSIQKHTLCWTRCTPVQLAAAEGERAPTEQHPRLAGCRRSGAQASTCQAEQPHPNSSHPVPPAATKVTPHGPPIPPGRCTRSTAGTRCPAPPAEGTRGTRDTWRGQGRERERGGYRHWGHQKLVRGDTSGQAWRSPAHAPLESAPRRNWQHSETPYSLARKRAAARQCFGFRGVQVQCLGLGAPMHRMALTAPHTLSRRPCKAHTPIHRTPLPTRMHPRSSGAASPSPPSLTR